MSKKKLSKKQKIRRQQELLKARNKTLRGYSGEEKIRTGSKDNDNVLVPLSEKKSVEPLGSFLLPVSQIKKDLVKIMLFALFSAAFLIFLKAGNISINAIKGFIF